MRLRAVLAALVAIVVAASFIVASADPAAALHGRERIVGKVTDGATGIALDNVCVVLGPSAARCWTSTNADGNYVIDLGAIAPPGFSTPVQFFRTGYANETRNVTVNNDTDTVVNVAMTRSDGGSGAPPAATPVPNTVQPAPTPPPAPTFTVYLPNITRMLGGRYGWHTPFIVQNVGTASTNLIVRYYGFTDGSLVATRTAAVLPGRSFVGSPNDDGDLPENAQFSVVITSTGSPVVAVVNEHQGGLGVTPEALSYSGISTGSTKVSLPLVSKMAGGWLTTMIIQNLGANPTVISAAFKRIGSAGSATITRTVLPGRSHRFSDGSLVTTQSVSLSIGASTRVDPRQVAGLADNTQYAVVLESGRQVVAIVTELNLSGGDNAMVYKAFLAP